MLYNSFFRKKSVFMIPPYPYLYNAILTSAIICSVRQICADTFWNNTIVIAAWKRNWFTLTTPPSDIISLDLFSVWHLSNLRHEALFGYYGNQLPSGLIWYLSMSEVCPSRWVEPGCLWKMEWNSWQMCSDVLCLVYIVNKLCLWPYRPQVTTHTNIYTHTCG